MRCKMAVMTEEAAENGVIRLQKPVKLKKKREAAPFGAASLFGHNF